MNLDEELEALKKRVLGSKDETSKQVNTANYTVATFDSIKHIDEYGNEFWLGRELQETLEYKEWRNFLNVIEKAKNTCINSHFDEQDHFVSTNKMVNIGSGAERFIEDIKLSRYACYLIVMNANENKEVIALGKTYFAVKTRQQELIEHYDDLSEDQKRLATRNEIIFHNKSLAEAAQMSGVIEPIDYAVFQNMGYQGLYGGLGVKEIHQHKGLKKSQKILDHMGSTELAANLFRATQTDEKLRRDHIIGKSAANQIHYNVGKEVRSTIERLGGTMPENLPTPEKSIKQIEKEQQKNIT